MPAVVLGHVVGTLPRGGGRWASPLWSGVGEGLWLRLWGGRAVFIRVRRGEAGPLFVGRAVFRGGVEGATEEAGGATRGLQDLVPNGFVLHHFGRAFRLGHDEF